MNRIVTVVNSGLEYEADQRHAEILMRDMGIDEGSKGVVTPGSNGEGGPEFGGDRNESKFRAVAARGNYLAQDRMDIRSRRKRCPGSCRSPRIKTEGRRRDWQGI